MLIEMMKRETEVAMRTHFEIFKNETESNVQKKVEQKDLKAMLATKVSTSEFFREMEHLKGMMHTMSRELAVAGIGGSNVSSSAASKGSGGSAALRTLIKQECENKVDKDALDDML
jgi:hypothetical protein